MEAQKEKARAGSAFGLAASGSAAFEAGTEGLRGTADRFEGYTATRVDGATVLATLDDEGQPIDVLSEGQTGYVALDRTPFYVESGGQVSDIGTLASEAGTLAQVHGLVKAGADRPRLHRVQVTAGDLQPRDTVVAAVDDAARDATRRNHTATHLLHAALRQVLGSHVKQGGSLVSPDRLRFDFAHDSALTAEQLEQVESIVNAQIWRNTPVQTELKSTDEAIAAGATALFGEKYGDTVRVVSVPGFSMELCGGTHVQATGDIGLFTIVQEGGVAAGLRRIEALTGAGALALHQAQRRDLDTVLAALKTPADQAEAAIERLNAEAKRLAKENSQLKMKLAMGGGAASGAADDDTVDAGGVKMVAPARPGARQDGARPAGRHAEEQAAERRGRAGVRERRTGVDRRICHEGPRPAHPRREHREEDRAAGRRRRRRPARLRRGGRQEPGGHRRRCSQRPAPWSRAWPDRVGSRLSALGARRCRRRPKPRAQSRSLRRQQWV